MEEWEDGMGIEMGQEFSSKEVVKDLMIEHQQRTVLGLLSLTLIHLDMRLDVEERKTVVNVC